MACKSLPLTCLSPDTGRLRVVHVARSSSRGQGHHRKLRAAHGRVVRARVRARVVADTHQPRRGERLTRNKRKPQRSHTPRHPIPLVRWSTRPRVPRVTLLRLAAVSANERLDTQLCDDTDASDTLYEPPKNAMPPLGVGRSLRSQRCAATGATTIQNNHGQAQKLGPRPQVGAAGMSGPQLVRLLLGEFESHLAPVLAKRARPHNQPEPTISNHDAPVTKTKSSTHF